MKIELALGRKSEIEIEIGAEEEEEEVHVRRSMSSDFLPDSLSDRERSIAFSSGIVSFVRSLGWRSSGWRSSGVENRRA